VHGFSFGGWGPFRAGALLSQNNAARTLDLMKKQRAIRTG
jgi:hypothetical protein